MKNWEDFYTEMITSACFSTPSGSGGSPVGENTPSNYVGSARQKKTFRKTKLQKYEDIILKKQRKKLGDKSSNNIL
jgi:hypothetical protein